MPDRPVEILALPPKLHELFDGRVPLKATGNKEQNERDFLSGFNAHITKRQVEIEGALEACSHIQLVVAHTGAGISNHAKTAIGDLLNDDHGEERLNDKVEDYGSARVAADLQAGQAFPRVDAKLTLRDWVVHGASKELFRSDDNQRSC